MQIWVFAVLFAAGVAALIRRAGLASGGPHLRGANPSRFERFWSRFDGRVLAGLWVAIFAAAWLAPFAVGVGDDSPYNSVQIHPIRDGVLLAVQAVAAIALVPLTAGIYLYKRAVPQIARDDADEREQLVQGLVYRRTHLLIMAALAVIGTLLALVPDVGRYLLTVARDHGALWIGLLLPAWVLLFMLPSVIYAWMYPKREDDGEVAAGAVTR